MYFEKRYLRKCKNIMCDKKLKRCMISEGGEYVHLNIIQLTKQLLQIMMNSTVEYCAKYEDEDINKYKDVFSTILIYKKFLKYLYFCLFLQQIHVIFHSFLNAAKTAIR